MRGNCRLRFAGGALIVVAGMLLAGFAVMLGSQLLVGLAAGLMTVPFALARMRGRLPDPEHGPAPASPTKLPQRHRVRVRPEAVAGLSDEQLILEWRVSFAALQLNWAGNDIPAVVDFRHRCLDELERRHPQGFEQWMLSGPRASGDPTPFL